MNKPIRKAVLPVAGLGTRFLPATKAVPKEMLTIVDRPVIQYVVDEAREAGIEHFVFVTGRNKAVIEDHFDTAYELEDMLGRRGKRQEYDALMADLPAAGATSFTRQQAPLGLGHAVWCAREIIGDEPFAVLLPDMITMSGKRAAGAVWRNVWKPTPGTAAISSRSRKSCRRKPINMESSRSAPIDGQTFEITGMVEKPKQGTAPSNLIISGRYILQPEIFGILKRVEQGAGGEIQLTDGMVALARSQAFHGVRFSGRTYDCGSKLGFLTANIAFAFERPDLAPALRAEIAKLGGGQ